MTDLPRARTVLPTGVTREVFRDRTPHQPDDDCVNHCYSHDLDEPPAAYQWCGECYHGFPTRWALYRDHIRAAARIYWQDLRHPATWYTTTRDIIWPRTDDPDDPFGGPWHVTRPAWRNRLSDLWALTRLPFTRTRDITFCPLCLHDF